MNNIHGMNFKIECSPNIIALLLVQLYNSLILFISWIIVNWIGE